MAERACFAFEYPLGISSIALLEVMHLLLQRLLFLLQGAGIYVDYGGEATLTNTKVFDNNAGAPLLSPQGNAYNSNVSGLHFEPSHRQFLRCSA